MTGKIIIISGPSGVGKGTIVEGLRDIPELNFYCAKSYTTRPKRESDEVENRYLFVDENEFHKLEKQGEIIESNNYNGNWYGSSKSEIDKAISQGKNILKDVDVNGAVAFKKLYPNAVLIFIKADAQDIKSRLISRGQNTKEEIENRLKIMQKEMKFEKEYDYSVVNPEGYPEKAIDYIIHIITSNI